MLGIELVKDRASKEPAKGRVRPSGGESPGPWAVAGQRRLMGPDHTIRSAMCAIQADADFLLDVLDTALAGI